MSVPLAIVLLTKLALRCGHSTGVDKGIIRELRAIQCTSHESKAAYGDTSQALLGESCVCILKSIHCFPHGCGERKDSRLPCFQ